MSSSYARNANNNNPYKNNTNTNTTTSTTNNNNIESKLHTVAASFRQKRDEAHRANQLAIERLRLSQEVVDTLNLNVKDLQYKLDTLKKNSGSTVEGKDIIQKLHQDVNILTKEVNIRIKLTLYYLTILLHIFS